MGQKDLLRQLSLPANDQEYKQTFEILKNTAGIVLGLRHAFDKFFHFLNEPTDLFKNASPGEQSILSKMKRSILLKRSFSDSFVFATPILRDYDFCTTINGLYAMIMAVSMITLISLSKKHSIRGGIALGPCLSFGQEEIYGGGLERAYTLESKYADYPRILIDERVIELCDEIIAIDPKSIFSRFAAQYARNSKLFVKSDLDGKYILDYLHDDIKLLYSDLDKIEIDILYNGAAEFVNESIINFKDNKKLLNRYLKLKDYFQTKGY